MTHGVIYLLTDMQLAARLVVSLYSLRRWYSGPITVFTTRPESHAIASRCVSDRRLQVHHERCDERPGRGSYHSSYLTKTVFLEASPYRLSVFLDADTVVNGDISELFLEARSVNLVATAFCGMKTTAKPTSDLLQCWRALQDDAKMRSYKLKTRLDQLLFKQFPAINSGVFAFRHVPRILRRWDALTLAARNLPHPDEIALQLMLFETDHKILGYQYNCHPNSWHGAFAPKIWHFAGCSHLDKGRCEHIWLPLYKECQRLQIAGIPEWSKVRATRNHTSANRR
jgi:hypothetical protein